MQKVSLFGLWVANFETRQRSDARHYISCGEHGVFAPEIFWKARGDKGLCAEAAIACVFKKLSGVNTPW